MFPYASYSSEFTELETVPTSFHLESPLERGPLVSSALPEAQDEPHERFFVCICFLCHVSHCESLFDLSSLFCNNEAVLPFKQLLDDILCYLKSYFEMQTSCT